MNITIKHFWHTGHSNWVLINEHGDYVYRTRLDDSFSPPLSGSTRKLAEELALGYADELNFDSIQVEYWYKGEKRFRQIK